MKNKLLIGLLSLLIATNIGAYLHYENKQETISNLKTEIKTKSTEIANLEAVIEDKEIELKSNEDLISSQKFQILSQKSEMDKMISKINNLEIELKSYDNLRQLDVVATAYTAFCDTGCIGITATGHDVSNTVYKDGYQVVAVDPRVIPLGSLVFVESEDRSFIGISADTGGDIKGNRIDVLVKNKSLAYDFGRQSAKVTVLRSGYEES